MNERIMQFRVGVMILATILITAILVSLFPGSSTLLHGTYDLHQVQRRPGRDPRHARPQGRHPHRPRAERAVCRRRRGGDRHGGDRSRPSCLQQRAVQGDQFAVDGRCLAGVRADGDLSRRKGRDQGRRRAARAVGPGHDRLDCQPAEAGGPDPGHAQHGRPRRTHRADPRRRAVGEERGSDQPHDRRGRRDDEDSRSRPWSPATICSATRNSASRSSRRSPKCRPCSRRRGPRWNGSGAPSPRWSTTCRTSRA